MNWLRRQWKSWRKRRPSMPPPMQPIRPPRRFFFWRRRGPKPPPPPEPIQIDRGSMLSRPFHRLWWTLCGLFQSICSSRPMHYWMQRDWKRLLYALPVLLATLGAIGVGIGVAQESKREMANWYHEQAIRSLRANDKPAAMAFAEAALGLQPDDSNILMLVGERSADNGDVARALAIFQSLAPPDKLGNPVAHMLCAELMAKQRQLTPDQWQEYEKHLQQIVDVEGKLGAAACGMLGNFYISSNQLDKAIPYLRRAPADSRYRVGLISAALRIGDTVTAKWAAEGSIGVLQAKLEANPNDLDARRMLAVCRVALKDHASAVALYDAVEISRMSPEVIALLRRERADLYVAWLHSLENDSAQSLTARFAVLERALFATPEDQRLLIKLSAFIDPRSKEGQAARKTLQDQLAKKGNNVGIAHFVLGLFAWAEQDQAKAQLHFELAHQATPLPTTHIANNLAWALASKADADRDYSHRLAIGAAVGAGIAAAPPVELERALRLVNGAVQREPNQRDFRHTRGTILIKMGRWKDAIVDLELALNAGAHPDQAGIHAALAEAYTRAGDAALAAAHREQAGPSKKSAEKR